MLRSEADTAFEDRASLAVVQNFQISNPPHYIPDSSTSFDAGVQVRKLDAHFLVSSRTTFA